MLVRSACRAQYLLDCREVSWLRPLWGEFFYNGLNFLITHGCEKGGVERIRHMRGQPENEARSIGGRAIDCHFPPNASNGQRLTRKIEQSFHGAIGCYVFHDSSVFRECSGVFLIPKGSESPLVEHSYNARTAVKTIHLHSECNISDCWREVGPYPQIPCVAFNGNAFAIPEVLGCALPGKPKPFRCGRRACQHQQCKCVQTSPHELPLARRVVSGYSRPRLAKSRHGIGLPASNGAARAPRPVRARLFMVGRVVSSFGGAVPLGGKTNHGTSGHHYWSFDGRAISNGDRP